MLRLLLKDLVRQSLRPQWLIVVDGDPESGQVRSVLRETEGAPWQLIYVKSNHANLPYQRFLGWKASPACECFIYFDDDLRISQTDCIEKLVEPLGWQHRKIAGVTCRIVLPGNRRQHGGMGVAGAHETTVAVEQPRSLLVRRFGGGARTTAGALTPTGHRRPPEWRGGLPYEAVEWLHGGVMAYRRSLLTAECFSDELFAMAEVGCGLGEDTILSRRVASKGELLFAFCAQVKHPGHDHSRAYATQDFPRGYATALSRRLINDNYRGLEPALPADRLDLLKSYVGTIAIEWMRALRSLQQRRFQYALGYSLGALRGIARRPGSARASRVDWWLDAERALIRMEAWKPGSTASA